MERDIIPYIAILATEVPFWTLSGTEMVTMLHDRFEVSATVDQVIEALEHIELEIVDVDEHYHSEPLRRETQPR